MIEVFNEEYYTGNNYTSYLERSERYERMVQELHYDFFRKLGLDFTQSSILDFGCAVGLVVNALQKSKIGDNVAGYDVSKWAVSYGQEKLKLNNLTNDYLAVLKNEYDLTYALDVLEHMSNDDLMNFLSGVNTKYLLVRIPVCRENGGKFVLTVSENDKTHVQRLTKMRWNTLLSYDFQFVCKLNLAHVYDTEGVFCALYRSLNHKIEL